MWENAASGLHLFILYDAMMHLTGYVMTNEIQIFHMETMDILNYNNIVQFYLNLHIWSGGYAGLGWGIGVVMIVFCSLYLMTLVSIK